MKISIIGCGRVGTTTAYAVMLKGLAKELVLVDVNTDRAIGEGLDLNHGTAELENIKISSGDYSQIAGSDIVIVTAGIPRKPGETRLDLASKNLNVIRDIVEQIKKYAPESFLLMVSNPVDVMTHLASKVFCPNKNKVLGLGNVLDQLRFRSLIGKEIGVHPRKVDAMIVGEHGDSMVVLDESITVSGMPLEKYKMIDRDRMDRIIHETKYGGAKVIALKGGTYYAVAIAICQVIEAISYDSLEILPVCFPQIHNGKEVTFSYPAIMGKNGIVGTIPLELGQEKQQMLEDSITAIDNMITYLKI